MKIIASFLIVSMFFGCNNKSEKEILTDNKTIEILKRDGENDLDLFSGDNLFKNNEARNLNNDGIDFIKKNQYKLAEKKFIAAYRLEPKNPIILNNLGNIYREIGTSKMAIEYFNDALLVSDSTYFNAAYNLGIVYCNIGKYEKSKEILEFIKSQSTDVNEIIFSEYVIVRVYVSQNECLKARTLYNKISTDLNKYPELKENRKILEERIKNCVQDRG